MLQLITKPDQTEYRRRRLLGLPCAELDGPHGARIAHIPAPKHYLAADLAVLELVVDSAAAKLYLPWSAVGLVLDDLMPELSRRDLDPQLLGMCLEAALGDAFDALEQVLGIAIECRTADRTTDAEVQPDAINFAARIVLPDLGRSFECAAELPAELASALDAAWRAVDTDDPQCTLALRVGWARLDRPASTLRANDIVVFEHSALALDRIALLADQDLGLLAAWDGNQLTAVGEWVPVTGAAIEQFVRPPATQPPAGELVLCDLFRTTAPIAHIRTLLATPTFDIPAWLKASIALCTADGRPFARGRLIRIDQRFGLRLLEVEDGGL